MGVWKVMHLWLENYINTPVRKGLIRKCYLTVKNYHLHKLLLSIIMFWVWTFFVNLLRFSIGSLIIIKLQFIFSNIIPIPHKKNINIKCWIWEKHHKSDQKFNNKTIFNSNDLVDMIKKINIAYSQLKIDKTHKTTQRKKPNILKWF